MKRARPGSTSPANEAANLARSRNRKPSCGGRIGGTGAPGGGLAIRVSTDLPASGANAAHSERADLGSLPACGDHLAAVEWPASSTAVTSRRRGRLSVLLVVQARDGGRWTSDDCLDLQSQRLVVAEALDALVAAGTASFDEAADILPVNDACRMSCRAGRDSFIDVASNYGRGEHHRCSDEQATAFARRVQASTQDRDDLRSSPTTRLRTLFR